MFVSRLLCAAVLVGARAAAQAPASASPARQQTVSAAKPAYKAELPPALVKRARVSEPKAASAALARVPGGRISAAELEEEDGKLIYSYDIVVAGRKGVEEVHVDAVTGAVIGSGHEGEATEKAEAAAGKAASAKGATKTAPARKKPPRR
ncbi:MAG TPA: PepSY domain-containing protein [Gemmatimonadaceae bacterium]|nr:PepSY domain-containing protein [Gemmatimonadaceae bacterium]